MGEQTHREGMSELATARSRIYGLLSLVYRREITAEVLYELTRPEFVQDLSELGISIPEEWFAGEEGEVLEALAVEYARLFLGPGPHFSPHESVHRHDEERSGLLWGTCTVEVKQFVEWLGLMYREDYHGLPDHVSVELECLQKLTEREAEAWSTGDEEGAYRCLRIERQFVEEHLAQWVPGFCDRVLEEADLSFYREVARLTKVWISEDREQVGELLEASSRMGFPTEHGQR